MEIQEYVFKFLINGWKKDTPKYFNKICMVMATPDKRTLKGKKVISPMPGI